jgi:uncharacterized membrane protein YeaQ/YmgE (transglycosylase-associated protein family)
MSIVAWVAVGLAAGLTANMLIPGKRSWGLIPTSMIGVAGMMIGGLAASGLWHTHTMRGFFSLSVPLTITGGAAALLLAYRLHAEQSGRPVGSPIAEKREGSSWKS